jgi:hypothetical protein
MTRTLTSTWYRKSKYLIEHNSTYGANQEAILATEHAGRSIYRSYSSSESSNARGMRIGLGGIHHLSSHPRTSHNRQNRSDFWGKAANLNSNIFKYINVFLHLFIYECNEYMKHMREFLLSVHWLIGRDACPDRHQIYKTMYIQIEWAIDELEKTKEWKVQ